MKSSHPFLPCLTVMVSPTFPATGSQPVNEKGEKQKWGIAVTIVMARGDKHINANRKERCLPTAGFCFAPTNLPFHRPHPSLPNPFHPVRMYRLSLARKAVRIACCCPDANIA